MVLRIPAECPRCHPFDPLQETPLWDSGEYLEAANVHDGKLTLNCEAGHELVAKIPVHQFEVLFEFGCSALLDGYNREAVTSFASSLERYQEFSCRFLLAQRGLSREAIEGWWKQVKRQSERQLGSFVALWITEFGDNPPILRQNLVELRNECVHQGRIPPVAKTTAYGEAVLRAIIGGVVKLRNRFFDSREDYLDFVDKNILGYEDNDDEVVFYHWLGPTLIDELWQNAGEPSLQVQGPISPDSFGPIDEEEQRAVVAALEVDRLEWSLRAPNKNALDASRLTMDDALLALDDMCSQGRRRRS